MTREEIIKKFRKLNLWEREGERAPHKPLLVLYAIGKLLRGEDRLGYADIEEDLRNLLKEFGPWRTNHRPQDPFWRLRNEKDKVWEIPNEHKIQEGKRKNGKSTGDARIEDLRRYGIGGFPEPVAYQLQKDPRLAFEVVQNLLDSHFPFSYYEDILQAVDLPIPLPISQSRLPNFRENVLKAYNYRCAVCGFDVKLRHQPVALEASHIKWHRAGGPDTEVNGLALCSLHHKLFDRGVFTLSAQLEVLVSEYANGSVGFDEWLMKFHNKKIHFPQRSTYRPHENFTEWHLKEVFKGPYRERT